MPSLYCIFLIEKDDKGNLRIVQEAEKPPVAQSEAQKESSTLAQLP